MDITFRKEAPESVVRVVEEFFPKATRRGRTTDQQSGTSEIDCAAWLLRVWCARGRGYLCDMSIRWEGGTHRVVTA